MKIINLLPKEEQRQLQLDLVNHQIRKFWAMAFISLGIFILLGVATQQYLRISLGQLKDQTAESKAKLETADIKQLQQEVNGLNQNIKEIQSIRRQQYKWSDVLLEITEVLPDAAQLNSIQTDRATGKVIFLGKAQDRDTVIEVWSRLKKTNLFRDVDFPLPNLEMPTDSNFTYTFFVNLDMIKHEPAN